jgi:RNA polymerase sigma factor (sigma-70 family)
MGRLGERQPSVRSQRERDRLVAHYRRLSFLTAERWAKRYGLDLEDAVAECDLALVRSAELWVPDGERTFARYVATAMVNHLIKASRRARLPGRPRAPREDEWASRPDPRQCDPAEAVADHEERGAELGRLSWALAFLDPRSRQVIRARAAGERPGRVAQRLGVSRQRIEQIGLKALGRLRRLLRCDPAHDEAPGQWA